MSGAGRAWLLGITWTLAAAWGAAGAAQVRPEFTLSDAAGREVSASDFRGRFVLLYFGYTACPDVCPTDLARLSRALERLGPVADRIVPVFVEVDPRPKAPRVVADYALHFHPRMVALVGERAQIAAAAAAFGARYNVRELEGEVLVDHSNAFYLLDREGRLVAELPHWMSDGALLGALAHFTIDPSEVDAVAREGAGGAGRGAARPPGG